MPETAGPVLRLAGVSRSYHDGSRDVRVLDGVDLQVVAGERVAITGASGSGKSTLLHLAGGMDLPDGGRVELLGEAIDALAEPHRTRFRARNIGLVFQDYNLIDSLTAAENIELVGWLTGRRLDEDEVRRLATELDIAELLDRRPDQLSGGQQQRVAIARALIHEPHLVLADEPTGSLDEATAARVMDVFASAVEARGCALVLATHSDAIAARCDRRLALTGGRLTVLNGGATEGAASGRTANPAE
ncbi:MAG: ABC transporter ATP-binding protein [Wenzhouxiangellaceae bacterium]|nr:ABC transporter ATP-binding protein [Wenzhouxiangellaceae bacterium]